MFSSSSSCLSMSPLFCYYIVLSLRQMQKLCQHRKRVSIMSSVIYCISILFLFNCIDIHAIGTKNSNFDVDVLSHLGDIDNQYIPVGVIVLSDGTIVIAAHGSFNFSSYNASFNIISNDTSPNSDAKLIIIHRLVNGTNDLIYVIHDIIRIGHLSNNEINAICGNQNHDNFIVIGNFGIYGIEYNSSDKHVRLQWRNVSDDAICASGDCRCDIGDDSTSVMFTGDKVQVHEWNHNTDNIIYIHDSGKDIMNVAINTKDKLIYVCGEQQRTSHFWVAFVVVDNYQTGQELYRLYDTASSHVIPMGWHGNADTLARDVYYNSVTGKLYMIGQGTWLDNEFNYVSGTNLSIRADNIVIAENDAYSTYDNLGNAQWDYNVPSVYTAIFDGNSSSFEAGIWTLVRRSDNTSNTLNVDGGIAIDDVLDELYILQRATYAIENRNGITINNISVGEYTSPDGALIVFNRDLTERKYWAVFSAQPWGL